MAKPKRPDLSVGDFPIATRTITILEREGIKNASDLQNYTAKDLDNIEGLGTVSLAELKTFLKGYGVKLKKSPPKEKKAPKWDPQTREVLLMVQKGEIENYAQDMKRCGMMIERFGVETMMNLEFPKTTDCRNLRYFFSGGQIAGWVEKYVQQFAKIRLAQPAPAAVEEPKTSPVDSKKSGEPVIYNISPKQPKTLSDFLKGK